MAARSPQKVKGTEIERIAAAEDECQNLYQLAMQLIRQRRELRLGAVDLRSPTRIVKKFYPNRRGFVEEVVAYRVRELKE